MYFPFLLLVALLIAIVGARKIIAHHLQLILFKLTHQKSIAVVAYSLVFLPGVIIHEISHFFVAAFLGVPTGEITIFPTEESPDGKTIRLGSVQIKKTDFIRQSLIGVAPLVFGSIIILAITYYLLPELNFAILRQPLNYLWLYLIVCISNTMFLSPADLKSWPAMIFLILILLGITVWAGLTVPLLLAANLLNAAFMFTLILDVVVIFPLLIIERFLL